MNKHLMNHIKNFIGNQQHGFMPGRSCNTNLTEFSTFVANSLEKTDVIQVDVIYNDLSSAFDMIPTNVLLMALEHHGIIGSLLQWFCSCLSKRRQYVMIKDFKSEIFLVPSGVPQGGHYSTTAFNLVMNFSTRIINSSNIYLYADDSKIARAISSELDCIQLQNDCTAFATWCTSFGLRLNVSKCKSMTISRSRNQFNYVYHINDNVIEKVKKFNDLGVIFNSKFDFNDDLSFRVSRARSMLGIIKRLAHEFNDIMSLRILYTSLVRSRLEYCSIVWAPYYIGPTAAVENVQKQFLKFLNNDTELNNYEDLCKKFNLDKLCNRRKLASAMFCFDLLSHRIDSSELLHQINFHCPTRIFRHNEMLRPVRHATNYTRFNPVNSMQINFNTVQQFFDDRTSRESFKAYSLNYIRSI